MTVSHEAARGCGYRKPSANGVGIYLVGPDTQQPCGRLPIPLTHCSCCGAGIKPSRGWTWIRPRELFGVPEKQCPPQRVNNKFTKAPCGSCALGTGMPEGQHGLLWVGEAFYPRPEDFTREAARMGLSRKLGALPRGFELGVTRVYLAHRRAVWNVETQQYTAGVFSSFVPVGIDLVVADDEHPPERAVQLAEHLGERARILRVVPQTQQTEMWPVEPPEEEES